MVTDAEAREALTANLGNPARDRPYRAVVHERAISSLVGRGATEVEARQALLAVLGEMGGYVEAVDTTSFGPGREDAEVWWLPDP
jgi:hypothetical protein